MGSKPLMGSKTCQTALIHFFTKSPGRSARAFSSDGLDGDVYEINHCHADTFSGSPSTSTDPNSQRQRVKSVLVTTSKWVQPRRIPPLPVTSSICTFTYCFNLSGIRICRTNSHIGVLSSTADCICSYEWVVCVSCSRMSK